VTVLMLQALTGKSGTAGSATDQEATCAHVGRAK